MYNKITAIKSFDDEGKDITVNVSLKLKYNRLKSQKTVLKQIWKILMKKQINF